MNQQTSAKHGFLGRGRAWVAGLAMMTGAAVSSAGAIQLSLEPGNVSVAPGAGVDLTLSISGLGAGAAPSLGAFDVTVSFNPGVLTYDSLTFGDPVLGNQLGLTFLSSDGSTVDILGGSVNLFSISLDSVADLDAGQADTFILASLHFTAFAGGLSSMGLSNVVLGDAAGDPLIPDVVQGSDVRVVSASVVPEGGLFLPGLLLLSSSVGYALLRRR